MLTKRIAWLAATTALVFLAPAAHAVVRPVVSADGAVGLPGISRVQVRDAGRQARLDATPAWQSFRARHGAWRAVWNETTGSPHRAFGRGIALAGFADEATAVDRSVRDFVHSNPDLFGATTTLALVSARRSERVWYVRYQQTSNGVPVLFSDWEFRVGVNGKLFAFGADVERPSAAMPLRATVVDAAVREAAKQGLRFDSAVDQVTSAHELALLPYPTEDGTQYRLVQRADVRTANPPGNWLTWVDARTGEVLWRHNRVRYDVSGTVSGMIHPLQPNEPLVDRPFPHLTVSVGGNPVPTNAAGQYTSAGGDPVTVSAQLLGLYCDVNRQDGGDAGFSTSTPNPGTVNIDWGVNAGGVDGERDGYFHVNEAHDYVKGLEPGFTGLDYPVPTAVNIADICNAYWDGNGVNFFAAGGGCANTATIADVVYHEYGHGINDNVYADYGSPGGMFNGALHEGMADVNAVFMRDDPRIGVDFQGVGTILRNLDNTRRWPENASADPHEAGLIIGGAFWDLRQAVGLAVAEHLAHYAKHGIPDDGDDGVAMNEFFYETLIADDDNADLSDGTPHAQAIADAFNAHGIGTGFWLTVAHTPVADVATDAPVTVTATAQFSGPFGALDPNSVTLHVAYNRGAFTTVPMAATGNPDQYAASISPPGGTVVSYYVSASDIYGGTAVQPNGAPANLNRFLVGPASSAAFYDMETVAGWVGTAAGDNATTGKWIRANPVGTYNGTDQVQPEDDHTPDPGVNCWVTGNGSVGGSLGAADVDNGRTTLVSPIFDATAGGIAHPTVEYYRWYSNNAGATPGTDFWRVDVSNDGGTNWTSIENTNVSQASWLRVLFRVEDYLTPTNNMRMRFIAADEGDGSLVEAAVDDWRLIGFSAALLAAGDPVAAPLALAPAKPNPFRARTSFAFTLPAAGSAVVRVFDVNGRLVRTLADGTFAAGPHSATWDGRDAAGRRLASGAYFVRLQQDGKETVRSIVRLD